MNPFDEIAVEEAVRLREKLGDSCTLTVLSIGTERVGEAIKKALAMGADNAVHVLDSDAAGKDPWQIASIIAAYAGGENFDIIFTGMQSQDRGSAQVGVAVAELLNYSCATTLVGFSCDNGVITAKRELEGGIKGVVKLPLPALVTCQLGLNVPRYPTLPNIMKAKRKEITLLDVATLLREDSLAATTSFHPPAKKGGGIVLEGDAGELVDKVIAILKEKTAVLR
jgi:electron transfer flavoprotein beta subunit